MVNRILIFICILSTSACLKGQDSGQGHFLVEFEKFSPPVQDLVKSFEGQPAEQFLANDVHGDEHYLSDYKGKKVLLWFWSINNPKATNQIDAMVLLQQRNAEHLKIISFASESKSEVLEYLKAHPMDIDVIPNGEVFGQMAYGAEMGNPRIFVIDDFGIIKAALPEQAFVGHEQLLVSLESILKGI